MCDTGGSLAGGVVLSGRLLTGGHRSVEGEGELFFFGIFKFDILGGGCFGFCLDLRWLQWLVFGLDLHGGCALPIGRLVLHGGKATGVVW